MFDALDMFVSKRKYDELQSRYYQKERELKRLQKHVEAEVNCKDELFSIASVSNALGETNVYITVRLSNAGHYDFIRKLEKFIKKYFKKKSGGND